MEIEKIVHDGDHIFTCHFKDGETKQAGPNLVNMIGYTYFIDDDSYPEDGWEINHKDFLMDYHKKVSVDIKSGKIKPD